MMRCLECGQPMQWERRVGAYICRKCLSAVSRHGCGENAAKRSSSQRHLVAYLEKLAGSGVNGTAARELGEYEQGALYERNEY